MSMRKDKKRYVIVKKKNIYHKIKKNLIINFSLCMSLLRSDFFLLNKNLKENVPYINEGTADMHFLTNFNALEIFELTKAMKQLIRLFQFLQQKSISLLHISTDKEEYLTLLQSFFKYYPININLKCSLDSEKEKIVNHGGVKMQLILNSFSPKNVNTVIQRNYINKFFLINNINTKIETGNSGVYKIYNDLFDYKKIFFIAILINQVLKKY